MRKLLLHNPSVSPMGCHLPLHKGGFGAVLLMKTYTFSLQFPRVCSIIKEKGVDPMDKLEVLKRWISESSNIVFFGGAGVSTECVS